MSRPESRPESSPRPFDFADLGMPRPKAPPSARALPVPPAEPSVDELGADDILESDDIEPLEAAAAGIKGFDAPPSDPSGFEVGELDSFDEVEVEGLASSPLAPTPAPAPVAVIARPGPLALTGEAAQYVPPAEAAAPAVEAPKVEAAPESIKVDYTAPSPSTLIGMPAAPVTSPIALESVIVDDAFPEKTLEMRGNALSKVAEAAAALDANEPQQTEVLKRSDMPAMPSTQTVRGGMPATPPPTSVHTPAAALASHGAGWQKPNGAPVTQPHAQRPGSIAPVALDVAGLPRPAMPSIPAHAPVPSFHAQPPVKKGMSGLAIGGIVFAAVAFVGLVGIGGFAASRALSDKTESASLTPAVTTEGTPAAAAAPASEEPAAAAAANAAAPADPSAPATLDVSSLPSAPAPGAAPRGFTGSGSFTAPSAPATVAGTSAGLAPAAPRSAGGSALAAPGQGSTSSGIKTTALPPPGAAAATPAPGGSTPLPPPAAAPVAAAPAAAAPSSTGIVRVDPNLRAVVVDGSYRRAVDGVLTVSCGPHRIKAGMKEQQTVNVPCGGSVSL